jgi:nitrite reductase/ring-hydroxylating ferredoxin subunit
MSKNRLLFIVFSLFTVIVPLSCVEEEEPVLPYVKVDFSINLTVNQGLLNGGEPLVCRNVGYQGNGVIIFPMGFGDDAEFKAYDATCTRNISEESTAIKVDNNSTATCPRCKTVYNLLTGYAVNQNFHLQQYKAQRDLYDRLHITTY